MKEKKMDKTRIWINSLTGVKKALLKYGKVWLTMDGETYIYAEVKDSQTVWINFGLTEETVNFHESLTRIFDFLSKGQALIN